MLVVVACISRVEELEEDGFYEDKNHILQVLPEVKEETVEDWGHQIEDGSLIWHAVFQQPITEHVLDYVDECLHCQEGLLWLLKDCQDEFKSNDLRSYHVVTDLLVNFLLILAFNTEFDNAFEDKNCIIQCELSFVRLRVVRKVLTRGAV